MTEKKETETKQTRLVLIFILHNDRKERNWDKTNKTCINIHLTICLYSEKGNNNTHKTTKTNLVSNKQIQKIMKDLKTSRVRPSANESDTTCMRRWNTNTNLWKWRLWYFCVAKTSDLRIILTSVYCTMNGFCIPRYVPNTRLDI